MKLLLFPSDAFQQEECQKVIPVSSLGAEQAIQTTSWASQSSTMKKVQVCPLQILFYNKGSLTQTQLFY